MEQIIEEETIDNTIPSFAWKHGDFLNEYSKNVEDYLTYLQNESQFVDVDLMCKVLHESGKSAFETCFPDREKSPHAKSWWTTELSQLEKVLSTHFNKWKESEFPRDDDDVFFNRYRMVRKNFRRAVKNAQNKKI